MLFFGAQNQVKNQRTTHPIAELKNITIHLIREINISLTQCFHFSPFLLMEHLPLLAWETFPKKL